MKLQGSTTLVTGGASGLGEGVVRHLVANGGNVVIADLNSLRGEQVAAELGSAVRFVRADVTSEADVQQAVDTARQAFGALNAAVSCAGIGTVGTTLGKQGPLDLGLFKRTIEVNLVGTFNVCRLAAFAMKDNEPNADGERGALVNTASVAAFDGQVGQVSYSASKGGIVGMTLPMARDLARFGIRVMVVAPGIFDTPLLAGLPEAARASLGQQVPFPPRLGRPSELAMLVGQCLENPMLNGEVIRLDGALRMAPR